MSFYLRVLSYFRQSLGGIILSVVLMFLSALAGLLQPFPVGILIDTVLSDSPSTGWLHRAFLAVTPDGTLPRILALAGMMLALRVVQELLTLAQSLVTIKIGFSGLMRVRSELFQKLQALSIGYHKSTPQGDAIYRLSNDAYGFQAILNTFMNAILMSVIVLLVMTGIMLSLSWQLALIALSIVPLLWWMTMYGNRLISKGWQAAKEVDTDMTTSVQRSIAAISLVQAYGREADEFARFEATANRSVRAYLKVHWVELLYRLAIGMVFGLGTAAMFGYGGYLVYLGEMKVGALYICLSFLVQLYAPLQQLTGANSILQGSAVSAQRVFDVLDRDAVIFNAPDAAPLPPKPRTLQIDGIRFEYRKGEPVFSDVSLTLKPGEMIGLVGFSGVGKTTLLNLLPRFYDPLHGSIMLDGQDLRKVRVSDVRRHFAMVLQESIILPTTVAENIAYGRPEATDAQIRQAADQARASEFIDRLPQKYDTQISEAGSNLSGGQKQRISIARALLTEAPILVLDEPTSALDPQNELLIVETLYSLRGTRSIILVSHRISTVADCDRILVMDQGRIVELGTHAELLERRGVYYKMARHQMKLPQDATTPASPADPQ